MKHINIFKMSSDELYDAYGIEVYEDGTVYDPLEEMDFDTLSAWKVYIDGTEQGVASIQKFGGGRYWDDE